MASRAIAGTDADMTRRRRGRRRTIVALLGAWATFVALVFLWQAVTYSWLVALVAEWQFNLFGRYYPTLSYLLLVLLFASPVFLLVRGRWWDPTFGAARVPAVGRTIVGATRFMYAMVTVAVGCAAIALMSLLLILALPGERGSPQLLRADLAPSGPPRDGPAVLFGAIDYIRTSALDQDLGITRRSTRFAPIGLHGSADHMIRYLVELNIREVPDGAQPIEQRRGILKADALPGELERLYRYAGYDFARPYHVLYLSSRSLRAPHVEVAVEMAIAALVFGLIAGWQYLERRRLLRAVARQS